MRGGTQQKENTLLSGSCGQEARTRRSRARLVCAAPTGGLGTSPALVVEGLLARWRGTLSAGGGVTGKDTDR